MTKKYFIHFDFWGDDGFNTYWYGSVDINRDNMCPLDIAKEIIKDEWPDFNIESCNIKINSFNLV